MKNMNLTIIIGIILIAVGTFLTYFGSQKKAKDSEDRIIQKINQTEIKLENVLKEENLSDDAKKKVIKIENEFVGWAENIFQHINIRRLEITKNEGVCK